MSAPAIAATRKLVALVCRDVVDLLSDEARILIRSDADLATLGQLTAEVADMVDQLNEAADFLGEIRRILGKRFMEIVEADDAGLDRLAAAVMSPDSPCTEPGCCEPVQS